MLEMAIAQIFWQSAIHGDYARLSFLLDRAVGKVQPSQDDDEDKASRRELQSLTDRELLQVVKAKIHLLEKPE